MKNTKALYIEQTPEGKYAVRGAHAQKALAITDTQKEAIDKARDLRPGIAPDVERVRKTEVGGRDKWRSA